MSDIFQQWKFHPFLVGCNWQRSSFGGNSTSALWDIVDPSLYLLEITLTLSFLTLTMFLSVICAYLITNKNIHLTVKE